MKFLQAKRSRAKTLKHTRRAAAREKNPERQQLEQWFEERAARDIEITVKFAPGSICDKLKLMAENYDPETVSDEQIKQCVSDLLEASRTSRQAQRRPGFFSPARAAAGGCV